MSEQSEISSSRRALVSLLCGATVWGLAWHPYRTLEGMAVPAAAGAMLSYLVAFLLGLVLLRRRLAGFRPGALLILIGLTAGGCNLGYVMATVQGEVMRVLLLFYLAPLWTVLLSRVLLREKVSFAGTAVVILSLIGAAIMLWQPGQGGPIPGNRAEWIGLGAGFLFALSNVLSRKAQAVSVEAKSMAVFAGVALSGLAVTLIESTPFVLPDAAGWLLIGVLGVVMLATNLFVQYGLTHTPANRAIVIFLFELVVAAASSWLLAGEAMTVREWLGGGLIVAASLFSGKLESREPAAS